MSEKNIEARYVDNKFGLVLKNIQSNSVDDIAKAVKLVLDEDTKVSELYSHYGDSNGEFFSEKIGFFVPINELILTQRKGYDIDNLDRLYDSICKNIDIVLDKDNYYDFEKVALDLPQGSSIEEFIEKFNEFENNLSDEKKAEIEENDFSGEMFDMALNKFRNAQNLGEKYNLIVVDSSEKDFNLENHKDNARKLTKVEEKETYEFKEFLVNRFEQNLINIDATVDLTTFLNSEDYKDFSNDMISDFIAFSEDNNKNLREVFKEKAIDVKEDIESNIKVRDNMPKISIPYSKEYVEQKDMINLKKSYLEKTKEIEKELPKKETVKRTFSKEVEEETKENTKDFEIE
jgi:hypothetical protein